jgi:hypothetical protein
MLVLLSTTVQSMTSMTRMKTQNKMVFTLEFTNDSFSLRRRDS